MDALCHLGVDAATGDGQATAPVAVDEVQGKYGPVPQVFRVPEFLHVRSEILQKIVPGAAWDTGHGGVGKPRQTVGRLGDGAIAAAGVEAQFLAALRQTAGHLRGAAGAVRQHTGAVQAVEAPQAVRHLVNTGGLVPFPGTGIDDEDVTHKRAPSNP